MKEENALASFGAISNATRLKMLKALVSAGPQGMTAGELSSLVGASPSRASFHLTHLSDAGLVTFKRKSRQVIYSADFFALGELARYLIEDCCQNNAKVRACCGPAYHQNARLP